MDLEGVDEECSAGPTDQLPQIKFKAGGGQAIKYYAPPQPAGEVSPNFALIEQAEGYADILRRVPKAIPVAG